MEYLDNKLLSKNPAFIAQVFSELITKLFKNNSEKAFIYLKNKCLVSDPLLNETARFSMAKLAEDKNLEINQLLADFVTNISTSSSMTPLIKIISALLLLQLQKNVSEYKEPINSKIELSTHPFIKILQQNSQCDTQICIYKEIILSYSQETKLEPFVTELYKPLYLYCICSPILKLELSLLKQKMWSWLLRYDELNGTNITYGISGWLQIENKNNLEISAILIDEALQIRINSTRNLPKTDYLILFQTLILHNMILNGIDCRLIIKTLKESISKTEYCYHNVALMVLAKVILVCSPLYLLDVLELCLILLESKKCKPYSYLTIKSSLLLWVASPSLLTQNSMRVAKKILQYDDKICENKPVILATRLAIDKWDYLIFCNPHLFLVLELGIKIECTKKEEFSSWLEDLSRASIHFLKHIFTNLCSFLILKNMKTENKLKVLSIIMKCSSAHSELSPTVLSLILYLLSNTKHCKFHFELLKALPLMVNEKENTSKVIATIHAIGKESSALANFATRLMFDAWEIDTKCYSNLESFLLLKNHNTGERNILEDYVSKAYILKKLSEKCPYIYGKDIVAHFSKILNECVTSSGSLPTALAIEGIQHLCKAEIIDVVTTWAILSPKFKNENRPTVIKSFCSFIKEIPNLPYTKTYEKLNDEVIQYLWNCVVSNNTEEVIDAALDALASFKLEMICCHVPDQFLDDSFQNQEPFVNQRVVPGKTWLNFLLTCKSREGAVQFLIKLVSNEIANYLKYIYQIKKQKEPDNYAGLPTNSIVKVFGEFIIHNVTRVKDWTNTANEDLYINSLKILSQEYSKPLPPFNWCFLQELVHLPKMKHYCLDIACHQVVLSGSARRLVVNFIIAVTKNPQIKDSIIIYRNLKHLANSIQPATLREFFENSLHFILNNFANTDKSVLVTVLQHLKDVLEDKNIQHINKNQIEDVLNQLIFVTDMSSEPFNLMLSCITSCSQTTLERMSRFEQTFDQDDFNKKVKIRCHISRKPSSLSPFQWLNDIFDVGCRNNIKLHTYFDEISGSLKSNISHSDSPIWLLELLGQVQLKVAERFEVVEIEYFCDILTRVVVYFSGFFTILRKYDEDSIKYYFPAALTFLLEEPNWNIYVPQVLEWLHHMSAAKDIPKEYQHIFGWSLCCLRNQEEFCQNSKWMKYMNCEIYNRNKK